MLEDLFGDTPHVEVIGRIVEFLEDYEYSFPGTNEITTDLEITPDLLNGFDEDFLKMAYLVKYELMEIYRILKLKKEIDEILPDKPSFKEEFDKLSQNYQFYEEEMVKDFLTRRYGLISYVNHITPIVNSYFQENPKIIVFNPDSECDPLSNITIHIKIAKNSKEKEKEKLKKLNKELKNFNLFPNPIKSICWVELDCYESYFDDDEIDDHYKLFYESYRDSNKKLLEFL